MGAHLPTFRLLRSNTSARGTFGTLSWDGYPHCVTLELPWRANRVRESCIPAGTYVLQRVQSPKFGNTFEVTEVDGRSAILIHAANKTTQLLGCIALGEEFGHLDDQPAVLASGKAMAEFLAALAGHDTALLTISEAY